MSIISNLRSLFGAKNKEDNVPNESNALFWFLVWALIDGGTNEKKQPTATKTNHGWLMRKTAEETKEENYLSKTTDPACVGWS